MADRKILLCFSDTGGGHRSATEAIEAALTEVLQTLPSANKFEIIAENVAEKTHPINRGFVEMYNYLLRHSQMSMRLYYWLIHVLKPNDTEFGYMLAGPYMRGLLSEIKPDVCVSIHPMLNHFLARAIKDVGLGHKTKLVTVITDPNNQLWRGWACAESDLTIAPNQIVFDRLLSWGVPKDRVRIIGMPVHPTFTKPALTSREEFRRVLGLEPERLTVCINAGWAGGGNMMAVYKALDRIKRPIQVLFLCGHNQSLYQKALEQSALSTQPTAVLPFHDDMSDLMNALDLMVTKAGGLTTFEAVARRLPMAIDMITEPMPQEAGTIDILLKAGLAEPIRRPEDILDIIEKCQVVPDRDLKTLPTLESLDRVDAVYDIAKAIIECASPDKIDPEPHYVKRRRTYGTNSGAQQNSFEKEM